MKKIIEGRMYNTETAKLVGYWKNETYGRNLSYCEEILYYKRIGEFFLYGYGGPMSKYAELSGNNTWKAGRKIIPLTYDAAREWAAEHLTVSEYNAIFGDMNEDNTRKLVTLSMSVTTIEKAKRAASQAGMSLSAYIESLVTK